MITVLAIGSNVNDRYKNIIECLELIETFCEIIDSSHIYVTKPMYYENQNDFLNLVIKCKTNLSPFDLLEECQQLEIKLNRIKEFINGPRTIDVDILYYENEKITTDKLTIPHPRIMERDFVKVPLSDIGINLYENEIPNLPVYFQFGNKSIIIGQKTILMGVINKTPDSFTDNDKNFDDEESFQTIDDMIKYVDIIDIGGMSTKPGYSLISIDEEINRIDKTIKYIKNKNCVVSLDSFRCKVIEKYTNDIDIINDISGGNDEIYDIIKKYKKTYVLMCPNKIESIYDIDEYFNKKITELINHGIFRFQIILDPGCGYNKKSIYVLKHVEKIRNLKSKYPFLIGFSKKKSIIDQNGTDFSLICSSISVQKNIDMIRCHDYKETKNVICFVDNIYK